MIGIQGQQIPSWLPELSARGLKSVCIYGENVDSEEQLTGFVSELREVLGPEAIIAIDEEGGEVTRVDYRSGSRFAGNGYLGRLGDPEITARDGRLIAELLARLGVNLNLAPVADVNIEPTNPVIGIRSFGADQEMVAKHTAEFVTAHEGVGVGTTLKHFPGHGNTVSDSHTSLPKITGGLKELMATQFKPFESGIAAGASAVMLAHLDIGLAAPSSLSQEVVNLLRGPMGFQGLIITDALDMGALGHRSQLPSNAIRAMLIGVDLICLGPRTTLEEILEIETLAENLRVAELQNSDESLQRIKHFANRVPRGAKEVMPHYPQLETDVDFVTPIRIIRFLGESNAAIGEVPWYGEIVADYEVRTPEELSERLSLETQNVVLFRNARQMEEALSRLTEELLETVVPFVPDLSTQWAGKAHVTYGSARPQTKVLRALLQERRHSNVK